MKAAITGARGFVGRHLTAHLRASGDDVIPLDVDGADPADVTDRDAVFERIARTGPDALYHLAARSHVGDSWDDEADVHRVNVGGTANVLAAAARAGVRRVVVVGSSEQYGRVEPADLPIHEHVPLRPVSPYARSKAEAEALALDAFREHGLGVLCARAFSHTGPGQSTRFLVPALAARAVAAERSGVGEVVIGNVAPMRDYSDVRDVVRAYRLLVLHGEPGTVYNVCSGTAVSIGDLAGRIVALASRPLRLVVDHDLVRNDDVPLLVGSAQRIAEHTGWRPAVPLERTLRDVFERARDQRT